MQLNVLEERLSISINECLDRFRVQSGFAFAGNGFGVWQ